MRKYLILLLLCGFIGNSQNLYTKQIWGNKVAPSVNLLSGLFAYYPVDSNANDLKNGYNGTATDITYVSGGINNEASFNGTSSRISIPNQTDFNFTDGVNDKPFTLSFTYTPNPVVDATVFIVSKRNSFASYQIIMVSRKIQVGLFTTVTSAYIGQDSSLVLTSGTRYKITITYDGTKLASGIKVIINNVNTSAANLTSGTYTGMVSNTDEVTIGKWLPNAQYVTGTMDDICFWNRVLTTAEITANYNRTTNLL